GQCVLRDAGAIDAESPRLLVDEAAAQFDAASLLFGMDEMPDLVARARGAGEVQPVAARPVPGLGQDLDDVAVGELRPQRDDSPIHLGPDALMADICVDE